MLRTASYSHSIAKALLGVYYTVNYKQYDELYIFKENIVYPRPLYLWILGDTWGPVEVALHRPSSQIFTLRFITKGFQNPLQYFASFCCIPCCP